MDSICIIFIISIIMCGLWILCKRTIQTRENVKISGPKKCIILFGLCRHPSSLVNLEKIIDRYKYDTFGYINTINQSSIKLREGVCEELVNPQPFLKKYCKKYAVEDQTSSEKKINTLYKRCLKYGLAEGWESIDLIKFLLFQLYSLSMCYKSFDLDKYDLIYCLRIDQTYEHLPSPEYSPNTMFVDNGTYNEIYDRNYIITKDIAKYILNRIDDVLEYCSTNNKPIHSETFLKWIVEKYNIHVEFIDFIGLRVRCDNKIINS